MEHPSAQQLADYVQGLSPAQDALQVDRHVASCNQCRSLIQQLRAAQTEASVLRKVCASEGAKYLGCLTFDDLVLFIDGKLDDIDRSLVESHIQECAWCSEDLRSLIAFKESLIAEQRRRNPAPLELFKRIVSKLAGGPAMVRLRPAFGYGLAAVLLLVVLYSHYRTMEHLTLRLQRGETHTKAMEQRLAEIEEHIELRMQQQLAGVEKRPASKVPPKQSLQELERRVAAVEQKAQKLGVSARLADSRPGQKLGQTRDPRTPDFPRYFSLNAIEAQEVSFIVQDTGGQVLVTSDGRVEARHLTTLPENIRQKVKELIVHGKAAPVRTLLSALAVVPSQANLRSVREPFSLAPEENLRTPTVMLHSPVATATKTSRPVFRWSCEEAAEFKIVIARADTGEHVWEAETGTETSIIFPGELQRGKVYLWQVETNAMAISDVGWFWVMDEASLAEVQQTERSFGLSALTLVAVYEAYGLYDDAEEQLAKLMELNPHNPRVLTMVEKIREHRQRR